MRFQVQGTDTTTLRAKIWKTGHERTNGVAVDGN